MSSARFMYASPLKDFYFSDTSLAAFLPTDIAGYEISQKIPQRELWGESLPAKNHSRFYSQNSTRQGDISRPKSDVFENENAVWIYVELPGFKKHEISAFVEGSTLVVSTKVSKTDPNYERMITGYCLECNHLALIRRFNLPNYVDTDQITAKYEDGVLKIEIGILGHPSMARELGVEWKEPTNKTSISKEEEKSALGVGADSDSASSTASVAGSVTTDTKPESTEATQSPPAPERIPFQGGLVEIVPVTKEEEPMLESTGEDMSMGGTR